ncbi:hypothetical protein HYFRA_00007058 [Hymenoscyphus fraxineus]|uniref:2EXR domain-containing protein n=1 Tax=Hymenoscyphus fraxineus TaxID=746836 RepID=A0A9N9KX17_9HELO|nr:hypothetical protein HYFRA_00007058 [Hymenoscyphus fraxineus]
MSSSSQSDVLAELIGEDDIRTFHLFPKLVVWEFAMPEARLIQISTGRITHHLHYEVDSDGPPSGLLRANKESRGHLLKFWHPFLPETTDKWYDEEPHGYLQQISRMGYINPQIDTFYIGTGSYIASLAGLKILQKRFPILGNLRYMAWSIHFFRAECERSRSGETLYDYWGLSRPNRPFPHLREFSIIIQAQCLRSQDLSLSTKVHLEKPFLWNYWFEGDTRQEVCRCLRIFHAMNGDPGSWNNRVLGLPITVKSAVAKDFINEGEANLVDLDELMKEAISPSAS